MARPKKIGLDYFPMDVDMDQDDKIYLVKAEYGWEGFAIVVKLFMEIYSEGYFLDWDERKLKIFSRKNLFDSEVVNGVINVCLSEDFFEETTFEKYGILTSKGIQTRYLEAVIRRKEIVLIKEYLLIDIDKATQSKVKLLNVDIYPNSIEVNDNINPQSKVKESKENKSKENYVGNEQTSVFNFYQQNGFGAITPHVGDKVHAWIDDLSSELVIHAMKIAVDNSKMNWAYVEAILKDWSNRKIKTVEEVEAGRLKFKQQQQSFRKPGKEEKVPGWMDDQRAVREGKKIVEEEKFSPEVEAQKQALFEKLGIKE